MHSILTIFFRYNCFVRTNNARVSNNQKRKNLKRLQSEAKDLAWPYVRLVVHVKIEGEQISPGNEVLLNRRRLSRQFRENVDVS